MNREEWMVRGLGVLFCFETVIEQSYYFSLLKTKGKKIEVLSILLR